MEPGPQLWMMGLLFQPPGISPDLCFSNRDASSTDQDVPPCQDVPRLVPLPHHTPQPLRKVQVHTVSSL